MMLDDSTTVADDQGVNAKPTDEPVSENLRIRLTPTLKAAWDAVLDERKISQQDAAMSLLAWAVAQDPMVQALLFGQVPEADKVGIAKMVLKRIVASQPAPQYGGLVGSTGTPGAKRKGK